jgi:hypothetical protein
MEKKNGMFYNKEEKTVEGSLNKNGEKQWKIY